MRQTLVQRRANLAHHRDVKDVERWPRESNPRDPVIDPEPDVLEFFRHLVAQVVNLRASVAIRASYQLAPHYSRQ
jgi:hypothetical protein